MKKNDTTGQALSRITQLESYDPSDDHIQELISLIAHRSNHVVGAAAQLLGIWEVTSATTALEVAFSRFMKNPVKTDPTCVAKHAIVETLTKLSSYTAALFLRAVRHTQFEPMWGDPVDTAPALRGMAGRALLSMHHPEAILIHTELLMDHAVETRRIAIDSMTEIGTNDAELLLRLCAKAPSLPDKPNDPNADSVRPECLRGLMKINPDRSLEFVTRFLYDSPEDLEGAALAIGESRHPEAFAILENTWRENVSGLRNALLLPMALTRKEEAFKFLCTILEDSDVASAKSALNALALYSGDKECVEWIHKCAGARDERSVLETYKSLFTEN